MLTRLISTRSILNSSRISNQLSTKKIVVVNGFDSKTTSNNNMKSLSSTTSISTKLNPTINRVNQFSTQSNQSQKQQRFNYSSFEQEKPTIQSNGITYMVKL